MSFLSLAKQTQIISGLVEGNSIRSMERLTGDEIEITAVVVGSYRTRSRPAQMQTKKSKQHR